LQYVSSSVCAIGDTGAAGGDNECSEQEQVLRGLREGELPKRITKAQNFDKEERADDRHHHRRAPTFAAARGGWGHVPQGKLCPYELSQVDAERNRVVAKWGIGVSSQGQRGQLFVAQ
jgi:hypothetical protein